MLLIVNLVLIGLIGLALWAAARRGRARAARARAARVTADRDLIPGRPVAAVPPRVVPHGPPGPATWSASRERGETAPPPPEPALPEFAPPVVPVPVVPVPAANGHGPTGRRAVLVVPRGSSWVVRRDGGSRASSVHATRSDAEERGRRTARRERVVLEVRDEAAAVLDHTDYSATTGPRPGSRR